MTRRRILPISLYLCDTDQEEGGSEGRSQGQGDESPEVPRRARFGRCVTLVGDSHSARRRLQQLRAAGADVRHLTAADLPSGFTAEHCQGAFLVMAHTDEPQRDRHIAQVARAAGCLAYAHDQPGVSDFAMPAVTRRGPLSIAIATDGTAPALARRMRALMQTLLESAGSAFDEFVQQLIEARARLPRAERAAALGAMVERLRLAGDLHVQPARAATDTASQRPD